MLKLLFSQIHLPLIQIQALSAQVNLVFPLHQGAEEERIWRFNILTRLKDFILDGG